MRFFDKLRLNTKLQILFAIITVGIFFTGTVGYMNISTMKRHLDLLYFGTLVPTVELENITLSYYEELEKPVFLAKSGIIESGDAIERMKSGLSNIERYWDSYKGRYKTESESLLVSETTQKIEKTNAYFRKILDYFQKGLDPKKISTSTLANNTKVIQSSLKALIHNEIENAQKNRKHLILAYNSTLQQLIVIFILTLVAVLFIAATIFKSIHKQQEQLESTHEKLKVVNHKLKNASYTDPLTTLNNRRYFNIVFDKEIKRAARESSYFTFMMMDIDFFKLYNDTYGHIEGDNCLKHVSLALKTTIQRPGDYIFRLGGEEFGVILTGTDPYNSEQVAKKINDNVEGLNIPHMKNKASDYVTLSIGVVCLIPTKMTDADALITKADENLYEVKKRSRNGCLMTTM